MEDQWLHNFLNCLGHRQGFDLIAKVWPVYLLSGTIALSVMSQS